MDNNGVKHAKFEQFIQLIAYVTSLVNGLQPISPWIISHCFISDNFSQN